MRTLNLPLSEICMSRYAEDLAQGEVTGELKGRDYPEHSFEVLVDSIRSEGVLLPIIVCANKDNEEKPYRIIDGDHRYLGAMTCYREAVEKKGAENVPLSLSTIPVLLKEEDENGENTIDYSYNYILNGKRVNLSRHEESDLLERHMNRFHVSEKEARDAFGIKSGKDYTVIQAYRNLDENTKQAFRDGILPETDNIIMAVQQIPDEEYRQYYINMAVKNGGMATRDYPEYFSAVSELLSLPMSVQNYFGPDGIQIDKRNIGLFKRLEQLLSEEELEKVAKKYTGDDISRSKMIRATPVYLSLVNKCPEFAGLLTEDGFPTDTQTIEKISDLKNLISDESSKRKAVVEYLLKNEALDYAHLNNLMSNVQNSLLHYPENIQYLFWDGKLPLDSGLFEILDSDNAKNFSEEQLLAMLSKFAGTNSAPNYICDSLKSEMSKQILTAKEAARIAGVSMEEVLTEPDKVVDKLFQEEEYEDRADSDEKDSGYGYGSGEYHPEGSRTRGSLNTHAVEENLPEDEDEEVFDADDISDENGMKLKEYPELDGAINTFAEVNFARMQNDIAEIMKSSILSDEINYEACGDNCKHCQSGWLIQDNTRCANCKFLCKELRYAMKKGNYTLNSDKVFEKINTITAKVN